MIAGHPVQAHAAIKACNTVPILEKLSEDCLFSHCNKETGK